MPDEQPDATTPFHMDPVFGVPNEWTWPTERRKGGHRGGRPLVVGPDGNIAAYRRPSQHAKLIADGHALTRWTVHTTAKGLAHPDGAGLLGELRDTELDWNGLERVTGKAFQLGGGYDAADWGTNVHKVIEQRWLGAKVTVTDPVMARDIAAYDAAMAAAGYDIVCVEQFRVHDDRMFAGSADMILDDGDHLMIGDTKTGRHLEYSALEIACQLAIYARSTAYHPPTDQRRVDPKSMNTAEGLIIHLPRGEGRCDFYTVNLMAGWDAVESADEVAELRRRRPVANTAGPGILTKATDTQALSYADMIGDYDDAAELRQWFTRLPVAEQTEELRDKCRNYVAGMEIMSAGKPARRGIRVKAAS